MRITKTKLTKKESRQITKMVDNLVKVDDFTIAVDFAKDAYVLFNEEFSKRRTFKSFWELFKDIRNLYAKFRVGKLMTNVNFYDKLRTFFHYFITSSLFRELDKLDAIEALEKFLVMFKPPQKQPPQSQPQTQSKRQPQAQPRSQKRKGKGKKQRKGESPSGKSKDKKGLSGSENSIPIDMSEFRQKLPKIEKAINSGIFDKEDFQKYLGRKAGIGHKEITIGNIVNLVDKISEQLSEKDLNIFYIARDKELTERYKRDKILKSVPCPDNEMSIKSLDKYQDLLKILPSQYALDDKIFDRKLINKELLVRDYQSRSLKKQALYLLVDVSGSMQDGRKNAYASGAALSLVRQAVSEGSTYFLRFFDESPHDLHKITNKKEAEKMCDDLVREPYSGGGTKIDNAIDKAIEDIKNDPVVFEKAEIMVITDGEDFVSSDKKRLGKIKLHSTVIDGENENLEKISDSYTKLDSKDIAIC